MFRSDGTLTYGYNCVIEQGEEVLSRTYKGSKAVPIGETYEKTVLVPDRTFLGSM